MKFSISLNYCRFLLSVRRCGGCDCILVPKRKDVYVVLTGMVWFIFVYFFWKIGDPFPILSPKHGQSEFLWYTRHGLFLCSCEMLKLRFPLCSNPGSWLKMQNMGFNFPSVL